MVAVRGLQVDLNKVTSIGGELESIFDRTKAQINDTTLRVIVHGLNINELAPGAHLIGQIPVKFNNPYEISIENLIVGGSGDQALHNVDAEVVVYTVDVPSSVQELLPVKYALRQNYPNPFNPITNITFSVPHTSQVRITVYNMLGQKVRTLFAGQMERGIETISWDTKDQSGRALAAGMYIYRMQAETYDKSRKMLY